MGIFTRFRDIVSSNINSMLDKAEDPEKMLKLMIREMEDTLVELKASCAGVMAESRKTKRLIDESVYRSKYWEEKASIAVSKGKDDLAREALVEKHRFLDRSKILETEFSGHENLVSQYQEDLRQLEDKLGSAREKQKILIERHIHAEKKKRAQEEIRRVESSEAIFKFEEFESRVDRMEAEAGLVNPRRRKVSLQEEIETLSIEDEIEKELQALKSSPKIAGAPGSCS